MSADPLAGASGLIDRVYALLVEARLTRDQLQAMVPTDSNAEAERAVFLKMTTSVERDLVLALEHVLAELKGMAVSAEAQAWWKRQTEGSGSGGA